MGMCMALNSLQSAAGRFVRTEPLEHFRGSVFLNIYFEIQTI